MTKNEKLTKREILNWIDSECARVENSDRYTDDYVSGFQTAMLSAERLIKQLPGEMAE